MSEGNGQDALAALAEHERRFPRGALAEERIADFTTEVHGLKSVLRNIGAAEDGGTAARLESAAIAGNTDSIKEEYPAFKQSLAKLMELLDKAVTLNSPREKETIDKETLLTALKSAKTAAEGYDTMQALETLEPLADSTYSEEIDTLLEKVIFALQEFDCEGAINNIINMEENLQ